MPNVRSFTGMSERAWKKVNFPKLAKILPLLKRTTKKLALSLKTEVKVRESTKMKLRFILDHHSPARCIVTPYAHIFANHSCNGSRSGSGCAQQYDLNKQRFGKCKCNAQNI
mmetsp:Transcript_19502/g.37748  ORF Transcript_19502/g.37748 Transcript_19502/m.37748 type:complete len:112 (+) Transcript_19502:1183-1518(+)